MDEDDIKKIEEMFKEVLDKAMEKQSALKDEAVILQSADGRRVELHSSQENINALLIKSTRKLSELNNTPAPPRDARYVD